MTTSDALIAQRDDLVHRLNAGWDIIEDHLSRGEDVETLETHWIGLLRRYEFTCQQIARLENVRDHN